MKMTLEHLAGFLFVALGYGVKLHPGPTGDAARAPPHAAGPARLRSVPDRGGPQVVPGGTHAAGRWRVVSRLLLPMLCLLLAGCSATPSQVQTGVNTTIDLTNAVCALAPDSPVGQPYVDVICAVAQGVEQVVSVIVGAVDPVSDAGTTATMSVPVEQIRIRLPAPTAARFLDLHKARK